LGGEWLKIRKCLTPVGFSKHDKIYLKAPKKKRPYPLFPSRRKSGGGKPFPINVVPRPGKKNCPLVAQIVWVVVPSL